MTKIVHNTRLDRIEAKDGRKVLFHASTKGLSETVVEGILAGFGEDTTDLTISALEDAIAAAKARRGSVVPEGYRIRYGADQNCGDQMAKDLTAKVTTPEGVDVEACRVIADLNGVGDKFDAWQTKGLNPGMLRMNLGNVLRGKLRRDEEVRLG